MLWVFDKPNLQWRGETGATQSINTPPPPPAGNPAFLGDYTTTGNFSQWYSIECVDFGSRYGPGTVGDTGGAGFDTWRAANPTEYQATIVTDPVVGPVARFEVRSGDTPFLGTERSEAGSHYSQTGTDISYNMWYKFSTKFDATFPQNFPSLGWGLTNQWHATEGALSPPLAWYLDQIAGQWSLVINKQVVNAYVAIIPIFHVALGTAWHDIKMQINWSPDDTLGYVRLWHNGVRQTFLDGSQTYNVRTLVPGTANNRIYYKEGMYSQSMSPTRIVYHHGFSCAALEADL